MPNRTGKPKRSTDPLQWAHQMVKESTEEPAQPIAPPEPAQATPAEISQFMRAMGRRGGLKGGVNRMAQLTNEERSSLASKAARVRWSKKAGSPKK